MPKQHTLFGRPIPPFTPRRVAQLLGGIAIFALLTLFFTLPTSSHGHSWYKLTDVHGFSLSKLSSPFHPFRPAAHALRVQENGTSGDSGWYSNWNWLSPFSSSITFDENRSLLPPLRDRPAIYTYYDPTVKVAADRKAAEGEMLVTWRKAWWAHGFRPIILGPQDAVSNEIWPEIQKLKLKPEMQTEMSRWLAWERIGKGILSHYLVLPMGPYEDSLLSSLRRGEYPKLARYEGLGNGLFSGGEADITAAVKAVLSNKDLLISKDIIQAMPKEVFSVESAPEAIAYYDLEIVSSKYAQVGPAILDSIPKGLRMLNQLMNAHLHNTWQNIFSDGIAVLKPLPAHMSSTVEPALKLAQFLAQCPESPIPDSCPPNRPNCNPCAASTPMQISTPAHYKNSSILYTIGTIPHPFTLLSLNAIGERIDVPYVRRKTARDQYLTAVTKEHLGTGVSTSPRLIGFKEAVASPHGVSHSMWLSAEHPLPDDLDWHFGFKVQRPLLDPGKSEISSPPQDGPVPGEKELLAERKLLERATLFLSSPKVANVRLKEAVEAWNLGDVEAWRFARAFLLRSGMERQKWEKEEKSAGAGVGIESARREGWGRWFDQ